MRCPENRRSSSTSSHGARGALDRLDQARVGAASAQVAVHGSANLIVGRLRILREQLRTFDDLTVVAVPALQSLFVDDGLLQRLELRAVRELFLLCLPGRQSVAR